MTGNLYLKFESYSPSLREIDCQAVAHDIQFQIIDGGLIDSLNETLSQTLQVNLSIKAHKEDELIFNVYRVPLPLRKPNR